MPILKFSLINAYEREQFKGIFQEYLEELMLTVNNSVSPDIIENFPEYDLYFRDDPNHVPFKIFYEEPKLETIEEPTEDCNEESNEGTREINGEQKKEESPVYVGFFFLHLINTADFPQGVESIFTDNETVASLNHFYIFPEFRRKGMAWEFYNSIIRFCNENQWNTIWESDVRNIPANTFYDHVLSKLEGEFSYEVNITEYPNPRYENAPYNFYQVKLLS